MPVMRAVMQAWTILLFVSLLQLDVVTSQTSAGDLQFSAANYSITVLAVLPVGDNVLQSLAVTYTANPGNSLISVTCDTSLSSTDACNTFGVFTTNQRTTAWNGNIKLRKQLNFLQIPSYTLVLQATSGGSSVSQTIQINVIDKVPPVFLSSLTATISPITDPQQLILELNAIDGDSSQNRPIRYYIVSNPGGYFTVDELTGRVFNAKNITAQDPNWTALGYVTISVKAAVAFNATYALVDDPKSYTVANVVISLVLSENRPVFSTSVYSGNVNEKCPAGTLVSSLNIVVTSNNVGVSSFFGLSVDKYADIFYVNPSNGSRSVTARIAVINGSFLNYDIGQRVYTFNVVAQSLFTSARLSSVASVTVNLNDINDHNAVFAQSYYQASVSELAPGYTSVAKVLATDGDGSVRYGNASIVYALSQPSSVFRIDTGKGEITVAPCSTPGFGSCLDYDLKSSYNLTILAADANGDGKPTRTIVGISIINEHIDPPVFTPTSYYGIIDEYAPTLQTLLQVTASDIDGDIVTYSLIDNSACKCWTINPSTGVINNTRPITYADSPNHQGSFSLIAQATDGYSHNASASVTIRVNPVNKYAPVFTSNGSYSASVSSNLLPGTVITLLTATDLDSPYTPNGQIQFQLKGGCQDRFVINTVNGVGQVAVAPGTTLSVGTCVLNVEVDDLGSPQKSSTTTLSITISPFSGQPAFFPATILLRVPQSTPVGSAVANITAYGLANASMIYQLKGPITGRDVNNQPVTLTDSEQSVFVINPNTGQLAVNGTLNADRYTTWQALVVAVDSTPVPPTSGSGTVIVTIVPTNDKTPVFIAPWTPANPVYNVNLPDNSPAGTPVTTMTATHPNNNNNNIYYRILSSNPDGQFLIDNSTGIVTLSKQLSYDSNNPSTNFTVIAYDDGVPSLTSTATVNVQLKRQNNIAPIFNEASYNTFMYDNVTAGYQVVNVSANFTDTTTFGPVRYSLINSNGGFFTIDPVKGTIVVAPGANFSGTASPLSIYASAFNDASDPSQKRSAYVTITINLLASKSTPVFDQQSYLITIPDSAVVGQYVVKLSATSPSPTLTQYIVYDILSADNPGLFVLNHGTGVITAGSPLLGLTGTYRLNVGAYETKTPSPTAQITVTIFVVPTPGLQPDWLGPSGVYETTVREDVPVGTLVYSVSARSKSGSALIYSLTDASGQPVPDLYINPQNGTITSNQPLSYDREAFYSLQVAAKDTGNNQSASRFLYVTVLQVNIPRFPSYNSATPQQSCCSIPYAFKTYLTADSGTFVDSVQAFVANRPAVPISYSITQNDDNAPFSINQTGAIIVGSSLISVPVNRVFRLKVHASAPNQYPQFPVAGCQCSNGSDVYVNVTVASPSAGQQPVFNYASYNTCISEDAEIGDYVGEFGTNFDKTYKKYLVYTIDKVSSTFNNGTTQSLPVTSFRLSPSDHGTAVYLNSLVDQYINSFITIQLGAYVLNETATTSVKIWITRPRYEILVTTTQHMDYYATPANLNDVISTIKNNIEPNKTQVCISAITNHVATSDEPNPGTVDRTKTDLFLYIIDGRTDPLGLLTNFHVLDTAYSVEERIATGVTGITAVYPYWAYFNYVPIAAAVGIIIGLLLLALLLMCCCVCWIQIFAFCVRCCVKEKEPLIYQTQTHIHYENPMTSRLLEDQLITMPVGGEDFVDGMAMAYASGKHQDSGDSDVFQTRRQLISGSRSMTESPSIGTFDNIQIVAPLAAPPYDMTDSAGPVIPLTGGNANNNVLSTTETTTHYEERTSYVGDDHLRGGRTVSEVGAQSGLSGSNARQQPSETVSPSTVTLNDPTRNGSARIGATLYQAPTPYSGFAPTQNVVSAASYPTDDRGDRVVYDSTMPAPLRSLALQREMAYNDMPPRSSVIYDEYEDEFISNGVQPPHHASDVYQGEIRLGTLQPTRPLTTSRSGSNLYEHETGFMN